MPFYVPEFLLGPREFENNPVNESIKEVFICFGGFLTLRT